MPKKGGWMVGRTRHVRVYLTQEEHALVRAAAARVDRSVSRFSVESIVDAAKRLVEEEAPATKAKKEKGKEKQPSFTTRGDTR